MSYGLKRLTTERIMMALNTQYGSHIKHGVRNNKLSKATVAEIRMLIVVTAPASLFTTVLEVLADTGNAPTKQPTTLDIPNAMSSYSIRVSYEFLFNKG